MKRAYFTIADRNNLKYYELLKNSLAKFTIDPVKVARSALENAVSIACMCMTCEFLITDLVKEKK